MHLSELRGVGRLLKRKIQGKPFFFMQKPQSDFVLNKGHGTPTEP
jgi:hypothetical protein